ncbi:hypothetical protein P154DRAFT_538741 [Amniculicola lignicola CBS 123094]|uniref:Zn(2)-C6 fungal-type domain-containing protein n=1 Tax=Amniculicola lignicola CBS 123094 TaxID=1392246 RepID=A0A6A5W0N4_9PLEO|nr:hypothetical protein P154DRAFT_538741 [Amniculicola lignicola CBS 123094]
MSTLKQSTPGPQHSEIDLDGLIQSLPACKRCRDCRRGCDTLLPKCRQCTKAGVDCIFYDHGRNEFLPRSYIAELVSHVRRITAHSDPSPATSPATSLESASSSTVKADSVGNDQHHDHHFAYAGGSYRYLGAESCLVKSPRLQQAKVNPPDELDDDLLQLVSSQSRAKNNHELVRTYLVTIHPLYPIVNVNSRFLAPDVPRDLEPAEEFCLNMIYSIGCYLAPGTNPHYDYDGKLDYQQHKSYYYRSLADSFFKRAMLFLEASTEETTISTLRAVLLLAINSLFDPKSGNIGQQVALATRLALNLELQELSPEDSETIRNMHSTIFSIENEIASTLDRPATFPEPDCDLTFDPSKPSEFLCSLYRLQHRFRKGDPTVKSMLPLLDEYGRIMPGLQMALHQTHLLLNPCWGSAWHVLETVVAEGSVHVFLTPHWVYRAGTVLIQKLPSIYGGDLIVLYSNALVLLNLSSGKWPSAKALSASLSDLVKQMKVQHQPQKEYFRGEITMQGF